MENRPIVTGIATICVLVVLLSVSLYLQRGGLEDLGIVRAGFAQAEIAKHTPSAPPDIQGNKVYRKKLRNQRSPKEWKVYEDLEQDMIRYCRNLDEREYVKAYGLPEGTFRHFLKVLNDLAASPPIVTGESTDPYKLKLNQEHFLRVTGRENVSLFLEILANEAEMMESTAEMVFDWINKGMETKSPEIRMTQQELYLYAAFFLNTLSGKSYLWRRDSKTRILVTYYSVLVVDRANRDKMNRYNVDIAPAVAQLKDDLVNYRNLTYRGLYLKKLKALELPSSTAALPGPANSKQQTADGRQ
ncbi:MAG TPA: hypothetical protein VMB77_06720 [Syntrophales bacterium]|nr:hypothetical protein [Syntrophales bacterium]